MKSSSLCPSCYWIILHIICGFFINWFTTICVMLADVNVDNIWLSSVSDYMVGWIMEPVNHAKTYQPNKLTKLCSFSLAPKWSAFTTFYWEQWFYSKSSIYPGIPIICYPSPLYTYEYTNISTMLVSSSTQWTVLDCYRSGIAKSLAVTWVRLGGLWLLWHRADWVGCACCDM